MILLELEKIYKEGTCGNNTVVEMLSIEETYGYIVTADEDGHLTCDFDRECGIGTKEMLEVIPGFKMGGKGSN